MISVRCHEISLSQNPSRVLKPTAPLPDGLTTLKRRFRSLFRKTTTDQTANVDSIYVRAARVAENLIAHPQEVRVLHGDIHHWNIRHQAQRGWLAYDPKGLIGERTYDAANTLCNPDNLPELVTNEARLLKNAGILAKELRIDLSRVLSFTYAYACLSASWFLEIERDPSLPLKVAELIERTCAREKRCNLVLKPAY